MGIERQTIKIGRGAENDIQIKKPDISEYHVKITRTDKNSFFVEDLGSSNGTFVDDVPVRKVTIGAEDKLRISKNTYIDLKEIFKISSSGSISDTETDNTTFIEEFYKLKELWDETERQKKRIKNRHRYKTTLIRGGISLSILLIALPILGRENYMIIAVVGGMLPNFISMDPPDELRTIDERFQLKYNCPHCKKRLGQISWSSLADKGECPVCNKSFLK